MSSHNHSSDYGIFSFGGHFAPIILADVPAEIQAATSIQLALIIPFSFGSCHLLMGLFHPVVHPGYHSGYHSDRFHAGVQTHPGCHHCHGDSLLCSLECSRRCSFHYVLPGQEPPEGRQLPVQIIVLRISYVQTSDLGMTSEPSSNHP